MLLRNPNGRHSAWHARTPAPPAPEPRSTPVTDTTAGPTGIVGYNALVTGGGSGIGLGVAVALAAPVAPAMPATLP